MAFNNKRHSVPYNRIMGNINYFRALSLPYGHTITNIKNILTPGMLVRREWT